MSLFEQHMRKPLAETLRPTKISDVVGQEHITKPGTFLHTIVSKNQPTSLILWGPPGTGKTTLARILATGWDLYFLELSAVSSGLADVRTVITEAKKQRSLGNGTLLFVDEIHRFNKLQQDAFLPHIENGTIYLIGATTENPSFTLNNALLSRARVVVLELLNTQALNRLVAKTIKHLDVKLTQKAKRAIIHLAAGDGRIIINGLEIASKLATTATIGTIEVEQAMQKVLLNYDKNGDTHYIIISAFIKSMRGSATDAALYYLHRMLEAGEDPLFIARRMIIFASEDIGMAAPYALSLATAAYQAVERIGMPESNYILSHVVIALSESPKSRAVVNAMQAAKTAVTEHPSAQVPLHLRNATPGLMKDLGYGKNYRWQADFKHPKGFMPDEIQDEQFFVNDPEDINK